jgi:hypothetical protein
MHNNKNLLASLLVTAGIASSGVILAGGTTGNAKDSTSYSPDYGVRMNTMLSNNESKEDTSNGSSKFSERFNYLGLGKNKEKGLLSNNLELTGVVRFLTTFRHMDESYVDMTTSDNHIMFTDYPNSNAASGSNAGFPMLELNLQSKVKENFNFNVGYSLGHAFSGDIEGKSQSIGAVQNLNFGAQLKTGKIKTSIWAGEVLWTNLSRFTMGQPEFTDNFFERLPWDWYRNSFTRYQEYHSLSSNIGSQNLGRAPLQGGIGVMDFLPLQASIKVIYGVTNRSITSSNFGKGFPSYINGYRFEKYIFERTIRGKAGLNVYNKKAYTDFAGELPDNNTMYTLDFDVKVNKIKFTGEVGGSKIDNPGVTDGGEGFGVAFKTEFDRRAVLWPFSVEFYNLTKNFGDVNGSILNSNPTVKQAGYTNEFIYNDSYFGNVSNEVGQLVNNRRGVNLNLEANLGDLKIQFGYSVSQEIEKISDTLTIQHRVNALSRSRFRPWFQASGPYSRLKGFWFRTFETLTLENEGGFLDRKLLGFNAVDLRFKYRKKIGKKHEIVLINLTTANTIREGFSALASPVSDKNLVALLYNDFTAAFKVNKKFSLVGNFAVESVKGSTRTNLSPDEEKKGDSDADRVIDQIGHMYALGADYDLSRKVSFHLRTKYMDHEDKNFLKDKFSGYETTFELKIFF